MPTIVDRDLVVALLHEELDAIADLARGFDAAAWATPTCLPSWTVQDVVSHIAGTEAMLLGEPAPKVDVSHLPHLRNDVARAGEVWVEAMRSSSGADVLARYTDVVSRRLAVLDGMSQADFDAKSWTPAGPDETYGRFMRIRHYDCFMHEHDIRAALGLAERPDPRHVTSALEEPVVSLGYIVGKRAKVPGGHRVEITLTGAVERTLRVEVGERAAVVDAFADTPTVTLTLPATLFLRLTGGRETAEPHLGHDVVLGGDTALAATLAGNLAYTI